MASHNLPAVLLPFLMALLVSGIVVPVRFTEGRSGTLDPWVDGGQGTGPKILVNVNNVTKYCGEDITIKVGEIQTFEESL